MIGGRAAPLALAGATIAVSVSAVLIQEAATDAATVVWLRMALAVAMLAPWALPQLQAGAVGATRRDTILTVTAGALLAAHFITWTASLAYTSVAASVLLVSLHPLIVTPLGTVLHGDHVDARVLAGIGLAVGGTVVTCIGGFGAGGNALRGDLLALSGGVALAGYLLIGRARRNRSGVAAYSAVVYAVVSAAALGTAAIGGTLHSPNGRVIVACIGLAAICTVGGHTVFNWALRRLAASTVSLAFLGEPPLAAVLALLALGQHPPLSTIIGGVLILAGLAVTLSSAPATATVDPAAAGL
ncbi:MAG: DMT family transporter [Candidatus Dormibacteraeota bacterium]|uniref:DMT family transporter n=1 Tax=Candidatus Amunia macphersoniae TaxID=3127014 RepID=A0A934KNQ1_9BACT|nr:DMT family transporter [Candidatus Dormibacteraeota bacterium]